MNIVKKSCTAYNACRTFYVQIVKLLAVFERIHVDELAAAEAGFFGCERHEVAFEGVLQRGGALGGFGLVDEHIEEIVHDAAVAAAVTFDRLRSHRSCPWP